MSESTSANLNNMPSSLEPVEFVLLLRNAKGAAAISLIKQVTPNSSFQDSMVTGSTALTNEANTDTRVEVYAI